MEHRYFPNPFEDYNGQAFEIDKSGIRELIKNYIELIVTNTHSGHNTDSRGDLYVGDAGNLFTLDDQN